jgi:hypothetical protein
MSKTPPNPEEIILTASHRFYRWPCNPFIMDCAIAKKVSLPVYTSPESLGAVIQRITYRTILY